MRDSADSYDPAFGRVRRARSKRQRKFYQPYDDEATYVKRAWELQRLAGADADDATDGLPEGDRWSTWDQSTPLARGPKPHPKWLVTDLAAVDYELGVLKTGKEADVFLVRRGVPGTDRSCLLAAKRYRDATHRQFHRDAGYLEGRRTRDTRETRATANRTAFGRQAIASQWANAEFNALVQLYNARVPVPYPVQILGTEVLLEFIGDADGTGAPRLAETRPGPAELAILWGQLVEATATLASAGFAHGDLSPYNLLVHHGRLVMIDLPQLVDVISHSNGRSFLDRDAKNVATWFARAGHPDADPEALARLLAEEAHLALADDRENREDREPAALKGSPAGLRQEERQCICNAAGNLTTGQVPHCSLELQRPDRGCPPDAGARRAQPRHFDKYVFQLPIPRYDPADAAHARLTALAERAARVAATTTLPDVRFERQRKHIRDVLERHGIAKDIDAIVKALLDIAI